MKHCPANNEGKNEALNALIALLDQIAYAEGAYGKYLVGVEVSDGIHQSVVTSIEGKRRLRRNAIDAA